MSESLANKFICSVCSYYLTISLLLFLIKFPQKIWFLFSRNFSLAVKKQALHTQCFWFTLATPPREYCFTASRTQHLAIMVGSCHRGPLTHLIDKHIATIYISLHVYIIESKFKVHNCGGFVYRLLFSAFDCMSFCMHVLLKQSKFIVVPEWEKVVLVGVWEMLILLWEITRQL